MNLIRERIQEDLKVAMKARDADFVATLRFTLAAIKQQEIDNRVVLDDSSLSVLLEKLIKKYCDSIEQYQKAGRVDLVDKEKAQMQILEKYLPKKMTDAELADFIKQAIQVTGSSSARDMAKVMQYVKDNAPGRVDMKAASTLVKNNLGV